MFPKVKLEMRVRVNQMKVRARVSIKREPHVLRLRMGKHMACFNNVKKGRVARAQISSGVMARGKAGELRQKPDHTWLLTCAKELDCF